MEALDIMVDTIIGYSLDVPGLGLSECFTPCRHLRPYSRRENSHNLISPVMMIT